LTLEDRLRNPLTEVLGQRQYSQAALYRAAIRDTRFSSGFGMYPPPVVKPSKWRPAAWLVFKFGFVGGLGLFLNVYLMYVLTQISVLTVLLTSFLVNDALVFRGRARASGFLRRFSFFNSIASVDLLLRLPILWGFTTFLSVPVLLSNFDSILLTFAGRFLISEKKIWPKQHG